MIGVLKPTLPAELGWTRGDYANVVFWFQAAYAIGYLGFGRIVDWIGARLGYAIALVIWTIAHIAHGGVHQRHPVRHGPLRPRHRRIRQFPGRHQGGDRMVPGQGARLRDRHVQRRRQCRRDRHAFARALADRRLSAGGWPSSSPAFRHLGLAGRLARHLPRARASTSASRPAELAYIQQDPADPVHAACLWRSSLPGARPGPMRSASSSSIRSGGSSCSGCRASRRPLQSRHPASSARRWSRIYLLSDVGIVAGGWLSSRMIKARQERQSRAQDDDADLRLLGAADLVRANMCDNLWLGGAGHRRRRPPRTRPSRPISTPCPPTSSRAARSAR